MRRRNTGEGEALGDDRRAAPRAQYATFVRITAGGRQLDGRSESISATGLSVVVKEELPEGAAATARFALPVTNTMVSLPCSAVRSASHGDAFVVGLTFEVSSSEVQHEIRQFVDAFGDTAP